MDEAGAAAPTAAEKARRRYSDAEFAAALHEHQGRVSHAARELGCSTSTLKSRLQKSKTLRDIVDHYKVELVDLAEQRLREAVDEGQAWAIKLTLERQGRDRGWGEKPVAEVPDVSPLAAIRKTLADSLKAVEQEPADGV
jgi:transposase-like protein